jgi:hypothetical protein
LIDAIGGIATAVLAIIGLTGFDNAGMAAIATIVFGGALLIQGGTLLSEYAHVNMPTSTVRASSEALGGEGLPAMFLVGAAGAVLGVIALLSIASSTLTAIALIAFGSALVLSSGSVRQLYALQAANRVGTRSSSELLAGEMAAGSAGIQMLTGLAAIVLGVLAVCGVHTATLTLVGLLMLGVTIVVTGSTLSGLVLSFMRTGRAQLKQS